MFKGVIVFKFTNAGSKSEGMFPFLYTGEGNFIKIWLEGDTSLYGDELKVYDGKAVEITGAINEYSILAITEIKIINY